MAKTKRRAIRPAKPARKTTAPSSKRGTEPRSKLDQIATAMRSAKGATITELMALTGWQMHSVRGAIAGALKKKRGLNVTSDKVGGERVYRIAGRP